MEQFNRYFTHVRNMSIKFNSTRFNHYFIICEICQLNSRSTLITRKVKRTGLKKLLAEEYWIYGVKRVYMEYIEGITHFDLSWDHRRSRTLERTAMQWYAGRWIGERAKRKRRSEGGLRERGIRRSRRRSGPLIKALAPNESSIYLPPTRR